jgi:hypothetical protein
LFSLSVRCQSRNGRTATNAGASEEAAQIQVEADIENLRRRWGQQIVIIIVFIKNQIVTQSTFPLL